MRNLITILWFCLGLSVFAGPQQMMLNNFSHPSSGGGFGSVTTGLVDWYKFDESSGNYCYDSAASPVIGKLTNNGTSFTSGKFGNCISFSGSNPSYVTNTGGYAFGTNDVTFSFWVKPSSFNIYQDILDTLNPGGPSSRPNSLCVDIYSASGNLGLWYADGWKDITTLTLTLNAWNHIILYRSGGVWSMWINGVHDSTTYANTNSDYGLGLVIGCSADTIGNQIFTGYEDDLRIYSRALTPTEIALIYAGNG